MKLGDLIQQLTTLKKAHGDLDVYSRDFMSGIGGAVIPRCGPRIDTLAALDGRQRKRRLLNAANCDTRKREPGEAVVIL